MSKNIQELERERDAEIVRLAKINADWSYRRIAAEVKRTYGKCSHEYVRKVLTRQGIERNK